MTKPLNLGGPVPADGGGAPEAANWQEQEVSIIDLAVIVLRHRRRILAVLVMLPLLVVGVSLVLPRGWSSNAAFMPQGGSEGGLPSQLASLAGQFGVELGSARSGSSPQFYVELVRSREILSQIARDTFSVTDTTWFVKRGPITGTLATLLDIEPRRPHLREVATVDWLRDEAISVGAGLDVGLVTVTVTTPWPELSAEILQRILTEVNIFNLATRQSEAAAERRFVEERLAAAEAELRGAETSLQTFLQNNRAFQNSPELAFEHDRLQREVLMRQDVYTSLAQSLEQARITEVRNTPVITVIERPEVPVRPDELYLIFRALIAAVVGGASAIAWVLMIEYVHRHRRTDAASYDELTGLWQETKSGFLVGSGRRTE